MMDALAFDQATPQRLLYNVDMLTPPRTFGSFDADIACVVICGSGRARRSTNPQWAIKRQSFLDSLL